MPKDYQPNSHWCFVCGLKNPAGLHVRFQNDGPGQVKIETQICDLHQGYPGIAHGGIAAAMLDEALGRAGVSGDHERFFYTAKLEVRYRVSVPLDTDLVIRGRIIKDRGRVATAEGEITLPDGVVAVEATATLFEIPTHEIDAMAGREYVGWKVYTDEEYAALMDELNR